MPKAEEAQAPAFGSDGFEDHWDLIKRSALLYGLLLGSSFVLGLVVRADHSRLPEVIFSAFDLAIVFVFAFVNRDQILALLGIPKTTIRTALKLATIAISFIIVMSGYFFVLRKLGIPILDSSASYRRAGWNNVEIFLLLSFMPAVTEELAFRGIIQSNLERVFSWRDAWVIQAALFSVLHLLPIMFPSHFIMGLVFGYLRLRSKSLYPGMLLHGAWNAIAVFQEIHAAHG